jgi:hypothetical protein
MNTILIAIIPAAALLLGVVVTNLFNQRAARITKECDERKHHKEVVVKAAIENWKQVADLALKSGLPGKVVPLDVFMIHMSVLADIIFDPTTNPTNLKRRLAEIDKWTDVAEESSKDLQLISSAKEK